MANNWYFRQRLPSPPHRGSSPWPRFLIDIYLCILSSLSGISFLLACFYLVAHPVGYSPPKGGKDTTPKKLPETDAIFEQLKEVNKEADANKQTLRISMDAKAIVKIGPFARGGKSRVPTKAADHDFHPEASVTPVGIFLPAFDEFFCSGVTSKVTSDCLVDRLRDWWETVKERFFPIKTIVINGDNGPESHSRRTQCMQRLLEFAETYQLNIFLAYYPPSQSKYNPVERCWGV